ncbi:MAG: FGGY-family carbohydrate kinase [Spirochaetaceae bacterium]|jgi:xylulokinase|nr:FGGY-family carbohydrate kinase [Spirochaetaceae bacterium]
MERCIFCADIGTSSLKAGLIDLEGRELGFAREVYPPDRLAAGRISANDWEDALFRAAGRLAGISADPAGVCISGNGPTLVPVSADDSAFPPLHWYSAVISPVSAESRAETLATLAALPKPKSFFLPHVLWFLRRKPEEYARTRYFFSAQEWLSFRLGADRVTVLPSDGYEPYYWDDEQCRSAGIDREKFPAFARLGSVIGTVSRSAGSRYGLPPGIPIIAGGPDFIMALLGVGAVKPGTVCDRAGTSEGINLCAETRLKSPSLRVLPHLEAGLWNIGGVIADSGRLFEQYRGLTGQDRRAYEEILGDLIDPEGGLSADKTLFFPKTGFLGKNSLNSSALGRGILEALGFMAREILDKFAQYGFSIAEMRVSGGQGRNALWNQLKADLTGCTLLIPEIRDGELAGDAALGAVALGEAGGFVSAAERMIRIRHRYDPNPLRREQYADAYQSYRLRWDQLSGLFG